MKKPRIITDVNVSLLTPEEQEVLHGLLKKYSACLFRITSAQRLEVFDISDEDFFRLQSELKDALPRRVNGLTDTCFKITSVRSCPGLEQCRYAVADAPRLGRKIECMRFAEPFPHKVKLSIAGCLMCCTEPYLRDVGIIAARKGWSISFGGNGGAKPRIGDLLAQGLAQEKVIPLVRKILIFYCQKAHRKERTARFVERYGIDRFRSEVLK